MLEHASTAVVVIAAIIAWGLQTYFRLTVRKLPREYSHDLWRWPRGVFGGLTVISSLYAIIAPHAFGVGRIEALDSYMLIGHGVILAAIGLRVWSQITLGTNWSTGVSVKQGHSLVTSGPYHWIRHPMYTGFGLMAIGVSLASGNALIMLVWSLFLPMLVQRALKEERFLKKKFGEAYIGYCQYTGRFLPRLARSYWLTGRRC